MAREMKSLLPTGGDHGFRHREHVAAKNRHMHVKKKRLRRAAYNERWGRIIDRRMKTDLRKLTKGVIDKNITT